jgi:hypothetical protein
MNEFDISIRQTIRRWEPWRKKALIGASIILPALGIWLYIWFTFFANGTGAILGN